MLYSNFNPILFSILSTFILSNTVNSTPLPFDSDLIPTFNDTTTLPNIQFPRYKNDKRVATVSSITLIAVLEIRAAALIIDDANQLKSAAAALALLKAPLSYYSAVIAFGASYTGK